MIKEQFRDALKLAISMTLFYAFALSMNWDMPKYGGLAIILISLGSVGASLQKGLLRIIGTTAGLIVGFIIIANFSQDRWLTMFSIAFYLLMVSYMMQRSRYNYAWYVAGFVPVIIWAVTYNKIDNVFHYAIFRYLETVTGVIIYTLVCAIIWPIKHGEKLYAKGKLIVEQQIKMIDGIVENIIKGKKVIVKNNVVAQFSSDIVSFENILNNAYVDTLDITSKKKLWQAHLGIVKKLSSNLILWQQIISDCKPKLIENSKSELECTLLILSTRFKLMQSLWAGTTTIQKDIDKQQMLQPIDIKLISSSFEYSLSEYACLVNYSKHFKLLDNISLQMLENLFVLLDNKPENNVQLSSESLSSKQLQKPLWDYRIFRRSFYPVITFILGFIFWVIINPPSGPDIPMMSAILGLSMLLSPSNPFKQLVILIPILTLIIAPIYFLIMPSLSGKEILILIFFYTLFFSMVGQRWKIFQTMPILMFIMLTNITNSQTYSFNTINDSTIMLSVSLMISGTVYMLFVYKNTEDEFLMLLKNYFLNVKCSINYLLDKRVIPNHYRFANLQSNISEISSLKITCLESLNFNESHIKKVTQHLQGVTLWLQLLGNLTPNVNRTISRLDVDSQKNILTLFTSIYELFDKLSCFNLMELVGGNFQEIIQSLNNLEIKHFQIINETHDEHLLEDVYSMLGTILGLIMSLKLLINSFEKIK